MIRKKVIRVLAVAALVALAALTVISNGVYEDSLPRVRTRMVEQEVGELLDGYALWETFAWIPRECVFPGTKPGTVCVYRVGQRAGQFAGMENYAEAVEPPVLDEREDAVLVEESYLSFYETLVCETNLPLNNGQTVVWLNPTT